METICNKNLNEKVVCRLCLMGTNISISLLEQNGIEMLENLTGIKITSESTFYNSACPRCWLNLKLATKIREKFIQANDKFFKDTKDSPDLVDVQLDDIDDCFEERLSDIEDNESIGAELIEIKVENHEDISESISEEEHNDESDFVTATGSCPICAKFSPSENIYQHIKMHYTESVNCEVCNEELKDIATYRSHLTSKHDVFDNKLFTCNKCNLKFQFKHFYDLHIENFGCNKPPSKKKSAQPKPKVKKEIDLFFSPETGKLKCLECNKTFTEQRAYLIHVKCHERVECKICGARVTKYNISKHVQMHSSGPSVCHLCGTTLKNMESLRGHLHYTHSQRVLECQYCDRVFTKLYSRNLHIKKEHTGEKGFICSTCGKSFYTQYDMNKHVKMTHLKLRPYICQYCKRGFSSRFAMRTHERQHTKEAPYICQICGEGFRQNVSLRAHKKSKHNIIESKSFECKICSKMFINDFAVKSHMRLH